MSKSALTKTYFFTGKHCQQANDLVGDRKSSFFKSNIDLYIVAALYGIVNNVRSVKDSSEQSTKIFDTAFENNYNDVWFVLQLAVICDPESKLPIEERLKKLYESPDVPPDYLSLLEAYVLGGLELIHARLFRRGAPLEEKIMAMTTSLMEMQEQSGDISFKNIRDKISEMKSI